MAAGEFKQILLMLWEKEDVRIIQIHFRNSLSNATEHMTIPSWTPVYKVKAVQ